MDDLLLWLDLETGGLTTHHSILEIAIVATDHQLEEWDAWQSLVKPNHTMESEVNVWLPRVRDMHRDSGLLHELLEAEQSPGLPHIDDVDDTATMWVHRNMAGVGAKRAVLCGSGTDRFDRRFLEWRMPKLAGMLHYSGGDVSPSRHMANWWSPRISAKLDQAKKSNPNPHRALDDARASIAQARILREVFSVAERWTAL